jgi:hypothetical protein
VSRHTRGDRLLRTVPNLSCMRALVFTMSSPACMEGSQALARLRRALSKQTRTQAVYGGTLHTPQANSFDCSSWRPWRLRPDDGSRLQVSSGANTWQLWSQEYIAAAVVTTPRTFREIVHEEDAPDLRRTIKPRTPSIPSQLRTPRQVERHAG